MSPRYRMTGGTCTQHIGHTFVYLPGQSKTPPDVRFLAGSSSLVSFPSPPSFGPGCQNSGTPLRGCQFSVKALFRLVKIEAQLETRQGRRHFSEVFVPFRAGMHHALSRAGRFPFAFGRDSDDNVSRFFVMRHSNVASKDFHCKTFPYWILLLWAVSLPVETFYQTFSPLSRVLIFFFQALPLGLSLNLETFYQTFSPLSRGKIFQALH